MQRQLEKKFEEIKNGIYDYLIQGVIRTDSNGYEYKTTSGNNIGQTYYKLKIILLKEDGNNYVYKNIFGKRDIKEIISGIGSPELKFYFDSDPVNFDPETLIGESGKLFLGRNEKNGKVYPNIECFIKPKGVIQESIKNTEIPKEEIEQFKKELEEDGVPF